jgi:serine/threonine-protein kinase
MTQAAAPSSNLTRVGEVVGTPEYMSPEQASGDVVDGRSDIYSLGLTAYYAATGTTAVTGESTQKILVRQLTERVPPIETLRTDLPSALATAIDRCVEKDPADRFATAEALVEQIDAAQLVEREIPLPIRLFAGELSTLSLALFVMLAIMWSAVETQLHASMTLLDTMLPVAGLLAIMVTRTLTTMSEGRRLAVAGFSAADVIDGMRRVMAERVTRRDELRADPETRGRRRRTIRWGVALLVIAVAFIRIAYGLRRPIGTNQYASPPLGIALVFSGFALLGTSFVLLAKSPFRMPPGERIFRLLWLGPIGRGFVRLSMRGVKTRGGVAVRPRAAPAVVAPIAFAGPPVHAAADPLLTLEARVKELERWRRSRGE